MTRTSCLFRWKKVSIITVALGLTVGPLCFGAKSIAQSQSSNPPETSNRPATGSNAGRERMAKQIPFVAAADRIIKLDRDGTGLGGIRIDLDRGVLQVWWKGDPPAAVHEEIDKRQRADGIRVELGSAKYSQRDLYEAGQSIMGDRDAYPGLIRLGPLVDGSGLEVGVEDTRRAASWKFPIPAKVVSASRIKQTQTRSADLPPWSAGAVTLPVFTGAGMCTTGFAVESGFWFWYSSGIITAEHCFPGGGDFNNGAGVLIGKGDVGRSHVHSDSLYIPSTVQARIYDGPIGGEFFKSVHGDTHAVPGQTVCVSGAVTGVRCDIMIDRINISSGYISTTGQPVDMITFGHSLGADHVATSDGDSGGPVFGIDDGGVLAIGMMEGGFEDPSVVSPPTACPPGPGSCYSGIAYVAIGLVYIRHGVSLMKQP
jgi:hypothetical protein